MDLVKVLQAQIHEVYKIAVEERHKSFNRGLIAFIIMSDDIKAAEKAIKENDVERMIFYCEMLMRRIVTSLKIKHL